MLTKIIEFFTGISLKIWGYVAFAAGAVWAVLKLVSFGKKEQRYEDLNKNIKVIKEADQIEDNVNSSSNDDVTKQLRDNGWINK